MRHHKTRDTHFDAPFPLRPADEKVDIPDDLTITQALADIWRTVEWLAEDTDNDNAQEFAADLAGAHSLIKAFLADLERRGLDAVIESWTIR